MQKRNVLNSPRLVELRRRRQKVLLTKIAIFAFAFIFGMTLLVLISRIPGLNINSVEVKGNKVVDAADIKSVVDQTISGKYLWLFPKTNILFYPKGHIVSALQDSFKRLKDVDASLTGRNTLGVTVSERAPLFTWCGVKVPDTQKSDTCYFLDKDGYIFDEAPYFSGEVYFKFYGDVVLENGNPAGSYFLKPDFAKIVTLKTMLEGMGLRPAAFYKDTGEDAKIFLSNSTTSVMGPEILFKTSDDLARVAENLQAAIITDPLKSNLKSKYSSLLYIDLRFGNKVYFKFK